MNPGVLCLAAAAIAGGAKEVAMDPAAWQAMPALPHPLFSHAAAAAGDSLYVFGGRNRTGGLLAGVWRADLDRKGAFVEWRRDRDLPGGLAETAATVCGGLLIVAGGMSAWRTGERAVERVLTARAGGGPLGPWTAGPPLPEPVYGAALAALGTRVFVLGGMGPAGHRATVLTAEVSGGRLGPWTAVMPLPVPLSAAAALGIGRFLVVIGGQAPGEGRTLVVPTAYVAPVAPDGTIPTWYLGSSKLPGAWLGFGRCQTAAVAHRGTLFCFGGQDALWFLLDTSARAAFDLARGEVGPWGVTPGPPDVPQITTAAVWRDWVYLMGGRVRGAVSGRVVRGEFTERTLDD